MTTQEQTNKVYQLNRMGHVSPSEKKEVNETSKPMAVIKAKFRFVKKDARIK
jgi:hypothetical protein